MFENIPNNWKKLEAEKYCFAVTDGTHDSPKPVEYNGIYLLTSKNITSGHLDYKNAYSISKEDFEKINKRSLVEKYDILFSMIGTVGESCIVDTDYINFAIKNVGLFKLNGDKIKAKWLNYFFKTANANLYIKQNLKGGNQKYIALNILRKFPIPVPPTLGEQQEIVDVLDAASEIIRLRTACIESAQSLIPALFQEMFGDINNNIHSLPISEIKSCVEINPTKIVMNDNDDVTFLGMKDVTENGQIDLSTIKKYEEVKKGFTSFKNGDVLLAKITPCFENGKAAIAKNLVNNTGFGSTEFYVLRPNQNKILPEYLYSIVKSSRFSEIGRSNMKGAAGQKRLIKDFVSNYKFLLPDIPQQKLYAAKVQEIEEYIKSQQAELENAKTMFQSILHHSFTGELTRRAYGE